MGSRLKENPDRTFYWFFEAACPIARDKDPGLLFQFPEDFSDEEARGTLPRFCFPYDIQRVRDGVAVQHFTFVLTDLEGCQRFGFCRLANTSKTCLCMLSYLPWFEVFYKLLNNLADYRTKGQTNEMKELLAALYKQPIPLAAGSVTLQLIPYFIAPDPRSLPSIPESRNLTELVVAVDVGNMLHLYASMLFERRILIFASKLSTLTACVHALSAVLYPMFWQHIFIPVLPPHLLDYCCAPMPYLIGVHSSLAEKVRGRGLEEVVILNVDTNTLETPFDDLKRIPPDVMSGLKVRLKRQAASPGWGVARAFLRAQALLFGGYRDALQGYKEGEVWFSEELFLDHRSPSMRQFLEGAVHLQFFKQFIDGRLELVNQGKEPDDLFEEEILHCRTAAGGTKSYQQLVGNLKKGGGALILNMKSKANMKAKGFTKRGLKNLLIPKDHDEARTLQRGGSVSHRRAQSDCLQNRLPITQHFGMSRPRRPVSRHRAATGDDDDTEDNRDTWDGAMSGPVAETDSDLQREEEEEGEDSLLCDPEEMDLLGEIFDTLSSRSVHERGLLYGTRSLDLFGPDSHDFITERGPATPSQESLSLSINGSGSLHSWNLEEGLHATEEGSDLTEDSGWLSLDPSVPEEEESESPPVAPTSELGGRESGLSELAEEREKGVRQEETEVGMYIKQEVNNERTNSKEAELEEEEKREKQEEKAHSREKDEEERVENHETKELLVNEEDERAGEEGVEEGGEVERGGQEVQGDLVREVKGEESQEGEKDAEMVEDLPRDGLMRLGNQSDRRPDRVEVAGEREERDGRVDPTTAVSPGARSLTAAPLWKPPAAREERDEVGGGEREVGQTPCPPKVLSAVARFGSQSSGQGLKFQTRGLSETGRSSDMTQSRKNLQSCPTKNSNITLGAGGLSEEAPPLIKVSELKKRFEA